MRLNRFVRAAAVAATLALTAVACGGDDGGSVTSEGEGSVSGTGSATATGTAEPTESDEGEGALAGEFDTVNDGELTVCSDIPYAPFEMEAEDGSGYTGFDIDLMRDVAEQLGLELNVQVTGFDAIQSGQALAAGACDVAASAMTITEEREENVDFTEPYFDAEQSLLAKTDGGIGSLDDVSTLGVQADTTGQAYAEENFDGEILEFPGAAELFTALEAGNIEAILQDLPVNAERAQQDDSLEIVETYSTGEQYGFAVEEGNTELLDAINQALQTLRDEGTYDELYGEYFEA
jgi:polar amino acid transport system substrate-binding protein